MARPFLPLFACLLTAAVLAAGCTPASDHDTAGSTAGASDLTKPLSGGEASAPDQAVINVVGSYIRERTVEGAPYYIDSSATEFAGFEDGVLRDDDSAICTAKFTSDRDVYHVRFVLTREIDRYVIEQVILEKLNGRAVQRTLFSRDTLVL